VSAREQYLDALGIELWRSRARPTGMASAQAASLGGQFIEAGADEALVAPDEWLARRAIAGTGIGVGAPPIVAADETAWEALRVQVSGCTRCELCKSRTQTVFGVGNRRAELLVIGEAPGAEEDRQGEPFVGRAGQLLNSMLRAMGNPRETVYIANMLKCRPPGNRDPKPEEVASCLPYLQQQVDMIQPRLMLAVGRIAAQNLLATDTPIGRLRGQVHRFGTRGTPLIVTYHPAYLLRSPGEKRKAWGDLKFARAELARTRAAAAGPAAAAAADAARGMDFGDRLDADAPGA
jgi:uracil-DNA glycosylase